MNFRITAKNTLIPLFYLLSILCGFSFANFAKIYGYPLFQLLFLIIPFVGVFFIRNIILERGEIWYFWYLIASLLAFFISSINSLFPWITFTYALLPLMAFIVFTQVLDIRVYNYGMRLILASVTIITVLGWSIFFNLIDRDFVTNFTNEGEFGIGYWGIRYETSTRNADYLYPLLGLCLSSYQYLKKPSFLYIILIIFFSFTLLASQSRGAILITALLLGFVLFQKNSKSLFAMLAFISFIVIWYVEINFELISLYTDIIISFFDANTSRNYSNSERIYIYTESIKNGFEYPFGVGLDNFGSSMSNSLTPDTNSGENAYLTIFVERGFLGLISFLLFMIITTVDTFRASFNLNTLLLPSMWLYLFFNYELNTIFANFILFIIMLTNKISRETDV